MLCCGGLSQLCVLCAQVGDIVTTITYVPHSAGTTKVTVFRVEKTGKISDTTK